MLEFSVKKLRVLKVLKSMLEGLPLPWGAKARAFCSSKHSSAPAVHSFY